MFDFDHVAAHSPAKEVLSDTISVPFTTPDPVKPPAPPIPHPQLKPAPNAEFDDKEPDGHPVPPQPVTPPPSPPHDALTDGGHEPPPTTTTPPPDSPKNRKARLAPLSEQVGYNNDPVQDGVRANLVGTHEPPPLPITPPPPSPPNPDGSDATDMAERPTLGLNGGAIGVHSKGGYEPPPVPHTPPPPSPPSPTPNGTSLRVICSTSESTERPTLDERGNDGDAHLAGGHEPPPVPHTPPPPSPPSLTPKGKSTSTTHYTIDSNGIITGADSTGEHEPPPVPHTPPPSSPKNGGSRTAADSLALATTASLVKANSSNPPDGHRPPPPPGTPPPPPPPKNNTLVPILSPNTFVYLVLTHLVEIITASGLAVESGKITFPFVDTFLPTVPSLAVAV
ncbi:hypothetical protein FRC07_003834 [Ceratobasidium sp. 392]|nr:hypothetical protein FRC07_003834 [Ceratobasidium sp. 392]